MSRSTSGAETREDDEPARADAKVVVPTPEPRAPQLRHLHPAPLGAVVERHVLQGDHAVRQAVELQVALRRRLVVDQKDRALPVGEELLEREDLSAKAQRVAREEPHLGEGVEHDALRVVRLDRLEHRAHRLLELHLGRMEERVALLDPRVAPQLENLDPLEVPTVGGGDIGQLLPAFGERDVESPLTLLAPLEQELEGEGRLARTRLAVHQVEMVDRQSAAEDVVEPFHAGRGTLDVASGVRRSRGSHVSWLKRRSSYRWGQDCGRNPVG